MLPLFLALLLCGPRVPGDDPKTPGRSYGNCLLHLHGRLPLVERVAEQLGCGPFQKHRLAEQNPVPALCVGSPSTFTNNVWKSLVQRTTGFLMVMLGAAQQPNVVPLFLAMASASAALGTSLA